MLVLVRLLTPAEYGSFALAQTFLGLLSVVSFSVFVTHALQARDPSEIDWQAHFTASVFINGVLAVVTLILAWVISHSFSYSAAAWPLAGLSLVFLVEIPGTMRHRMIQVSHDWKRFRIILITGGLLGSVVGIVVALMGGGIWALVIQPVLLGVPAAIDLFFIAKWRPDWTWSWPRYRATARFGATRIGSGALQRGSKVVEQTLLASTYDFTGLGMFTRAIGLATLIAGRIGSLVLDSLYPVITRAEQRSAQFRRYASLILRGVIWIVLPIAAILAFTAEDLVNLVYGAQWGDVVPLMPYAAAVSGIGGMTIASSSLVLANNEIRANLVLDLISAVLLVVVAILLIPVGMQAYLIGLTLHAVLVLVLSVGTLITTKGIDMTAVIKSFVPAGIAGVGGAVVVMMVRHSIGESEFLLLRIFCDAALFSIAYLFVLRVVFRHLLNEMFQVVPLGKHLSRILYMR